MEAGDFAIVSAFASLPLNVLAVATELRPHLPQHVFNDVNATAERGHVTEAGLLLVRNARQGGFMEALSLALEKLGFLEALDRLSAAAASVC